MPAFASRYQPDCHDNTLMPDGTTLVHGCRDQRDGGNNHFCDTAVNGTSCYAHLTVAKLACPDPGWCACADSSALPRSYTFRPFGV